MNPSRRWLIRGGIGLVIATLIAAGAVALSAPSLLAGQLRSRFHGNATFTDWWLGGRSAGVKGMVLRETNDASSTVWLSSDRVDTDLSIGGLLTGHFAPSRIILTGAKVRLRFDRRGQLLTRGPFSGDPATANAIPDIEIKESEVAIEQEGRPPMVITRVSGLLDRRSDGEDLKLSSDDPSWGRWTVDGRFETDFKSGTVRLASGAGFRATKGRTECVPFVPPEVWANVAPDGPIGVQVTLTVSKPPKKLIAVHTEIEFRGTTTDLPSLKIVASDTKGKMSVDDGLVRLDGLTGLTLQGTLGATGTLDFRDKSPTFDVELALQGIDVASTPPEWQLGEVGATGKLSGKARIKVALTLNGPDLSGSSGDAVIDGATLQGIAIKSLRLSMHASGEDLQFESKPDARSSRLLRFREWLSIGLVGFQAPAGLKPEDPRAEKPKPSEPRFRLPQSITTQIELADVDLVRLTERLEALTKIKIPVPIAGHLALKADATIPLGKLRDLKAYRFTGDATLTGASIDGVDLGRVAGRIDLNDGVLSIEKLRGQLVEHPNGGINDPPAPSGPIPIDAPISPGSFRGSLRAELSPSGRLTAHFQGQELPLGEIVAPYLPRPTPAAGRVTTEFDAQADIAHLGEARSWSVKGEVSSHQISYQGASLDAVATSFTIDRGKADLPDLKAQLAGRPLTGRLDVDLEAPRPFSGQIDATGWPIERLLALIPGAPRPSPATGLVDAHLSIRGTVQPRSIASEGKIFIHGATIESLPIGDVVANWVTEGDEIHVKEFQARPFSGRVTGEALIPVKPGRPIRLKVELTSIDTAKLTNAITHGSLQMTGSASGRLTATIPDGLKGLLVDLKLDAPALTVQGVPAGTVTIALREKDNLIEYEANADGPQGKVRFKGTLPLIVDLSRLGTTDAEIRAAGFSLADVWSLLGIKGPTHLLGRAAIDANLRVRQEAGFGFGLHGNLEVRDLSWGLHYPLGNLRGVLARTPSAWSIETIRGDLLGGEASGNVAGETPADGPRTMSFNLETDRASLKKIFGFVPSLEKRIEGFGTVRLTGQMADVMRMTAVVNVARARLAGMALSDFRIPADMTYSSTQATGIIHARRWSARIGGGRLLGNAWARLGVDRSFSTDISFTDLDVETIARVGTTSARPGSGKLNGRILLTGSDPSLPQRYRGKIDATLSDASLVEIPVIRELGRFLGAVQGGSFEAGELHATIGGQRIFVEELTLQGRILQIHATGAVGFNGALDLAVLVNTNQIIPQTGQALVSIIPGFREVVGRNEEAMLRVTNFLSNRLLKFRISGTIHNPNVVIDPGVVVSEAATGFFSGVLKLPLGFAK